MTLDRRLSISDPRFNTITWSRSTLYQNSNSTHLNAHRAHRPDHLKAQLQQAKDNAGDGGSKMIGKSAKFKDRDLLKAKIIKNWLSPNSASFINPD